MRFDGREIFGQMQHRQIGPIARTRNMRETLPGVIGYRVYQTAGPGPDTLVWTCTGRYVGTSLQDCERFISEAQAYMDGFPYVFETIGRQRVRNCTLIDYRQVSPYMRVITPEKLSLITVVVQGTIERMSL